MAKKPTPPPAPSKLTPEVLDRICEGVALGLPYERACLLGGISRATLYNWKDAAPESPEGSLHRQLVARLDEAHAKGQAELLDQMKGHARGVRLDNGAEVQTRGEWKATQWLLESIYKMRPESKVDVTSGGEPIKYIVSIPRVERIADPADDDDGG
jgi:hypothetical protein